MTLDPQTEERLIRKAAFIRSFESRLLRLYSEGVIHGTVHTCVGQEFCGIAIDEALEAGDIVLSNHRGHGHLLSRGGDPERLMAEIMGQSSGVCGGIGGSQHLCAEGFFSNGVLSGMSPVAAGVAYALKLKQSAHIAVVFLGDGAFGEGVVYESMNLASKWKLPLLVVVESNAYAQSTHVADTMAGTIAQRAAAFDIAYYSGTTWEWQELMSVSREAVSRTRAGAGPALLEIGTYRLNPHSKGDDHRNPEEIAAFAEKDPLNRWGKLHPDRFRELHGEIEQALDQVVAKARAAPSSTYKPEDPRVSRSTSWMPWSCERARHGDLINRALMDSFAADPRLIMIGEDIEDPYGGAFRISRNLSGAFPGRVRNTPISEAALVGVGTGLALSGLVPIVEIMFGDFMTLAFDQIYQHAAKMHGMYNGQCRVPLIVRTPMGGRRGYGPTHSQSIEKFFQGIPGLVVLALNNRLSPYDVYRQLVGTIEHPTLVIENKVLYTRLQESESVPGYVIECSDDPFPCLRLKPRTLSPDLTLVCYGGMLEVVERAQASLFEQHEIIAEVIVPTQIFPLNASPILESVRRTHRLLTVEEGPLVGGIGAEILARTAESGVPLASAARVGYDGVVPASPQLELALLPNVEAIVNAALRTAR
ncbi:MAG: pyruvate dehydrogenase [Phycisphaerae bacterium]|nr:pyruvate dehydrogenase [Phycisphaerae bacterium]